jgi:hypothetical protein
MSVSVLSEMRYETVTYGTRFRGTCTGSTSTFCSASSTRSSRGLRSDLFVRQSLDLNTPFLIGMFTAAAAGAGAGAFAAAGAFVAPCLFVSFMNSMDQPCSVYLQQHQQQPEPLQHQLPLQRPVCSSVL